MNLLRKRYIPYFVGAGPTQVATSTAPRTVLPSEAKPGDVLIAVVRVSGVQTITAASGWTLIGDALFNASAAHFSVYWKTMRDDPGADATWVLSGSVAWSTLTYAFRHVDQISPIVDTATKTENVASAATATLPAITTAAKTVLVGVMATQGNRHLLASHPLFKRTAVTNVQDAMMLVYSEPVPPDTWGTFANTLSSAAAHALQTFALRVTS